MPRLRLMLGGPAGSLPSTRAVRIGHRGSMRPDPEQFATQQPDSQSLSEPRNQLQLHVAATSRPARTTMVQSPTPTAASMLRRA
jgi:hypothetical protein